MTIRVLIADDHPLVRQGLQAALAPVTEVEIVAEAATGSTGSAGGACRLIANPWRPNRSICWLRAPRRPSSSSGAGRRS